MEGHKRLLKLLAFHEQAATAIRTVIRLLQGPAPTTTTADLRKALQLDAARKARNAAAYRQRKPKPQPRAPQKKRATTQHDSREARRSRTAMFLQQFDLSTAKTAAHSNGGFPSQGIGSLVRRGYLKAKGDGYIRTAKPYDVR